MISKEQLELLCDLYTKFIDRCEHICHNLLKDLNEFKHMTEFTLDIDSNRVECCGSDYNRFGLFGEYYEHFPVDFIYKSDEEILQWKNEILEKRRKEKEEKEKLIQKREQDCEYQRYLELKRKFIDISDYEYIAKEIDEYIKVFNSTRENCLDRITKK